MYKKLISIVFVVLALTLASTTYGIGIGDFENDMDGWVVYDDPDSSTDPNASVSYSPDGATSGSYSLRIETDPNFQRDIMYDLISNGMVDEFRKNLKVSLDATRLESEWIASGDVFCDFVVAVNAGSSAPGNEWSFWSQERATGWSLATDEAVSVTYDYSQALNQIDFDNLEYLELFICTSWGRYDPGGVYHVDNIQIFGGGPAYDPDPADGARDISNNTTLSWTPGLYADKHDVYVGTSFNDVNDASRADPLGVLLEQDYALNTYSVSDLEYGKNYYWRIDEVNDAADPDIWRGEIWSFTTAYPGTGYVLGDWEDNLDNWHIFDQASPTGRATLSYSTIGATLNNKSLRLEVPRDYWVIQLDISGEQLEALKAHDLFALDVTWVTSDWQGQSWSQVQEIAIQGYELSWKQTGWGDLPIVSDTGNPDSPGNWPPPDLGEIHTRTISWDYSGIGVDSIPKGEWCQIIISQNHSSSIGPGIYYFDNARLINSELASNPHPSNQQTDVKTEPMLSWKAGKDTVAHDVYLGTSFNDVNDVSTASLASYPAVIYTSIDTNSFKPGTLEYNTTYYWRVDEVRDNSDGLSKGYVWNFTTGNFIVVDDFEDYNDTSGNRIFDTWSDYGVNNTGMTVGHLVPPFAEKQTVHSDYQSMYLHYDNDGTVNEDTLYEQSGTLFYSETQRQWTDPQDWTRQNAESLTVWFRGVPASVGSFAPKGQAAGPPITITAGGADIWGTSDEFHFAYKQFSGVGSIAAKVVSLSNTDPWAKAGVMMRETLDAGAKHIAMVVTPGSGVSLQLRATTGSDSEEAATIAGVEAPQWVRLTRSGNTFTGEYSANGTTWQTVGSMTMPILTNLYAGLAVTSHNTNATCTAEFSDININGTVTGDWQSQDIGIESNIPEPMYIVLEDSSGNSVKIDHPDPAATVIKSWTEWKIPFADLTGLNMQAIKSLAIGVGDEADTQPGGAGTLYVDDIRLNRPE